MHPLNSYDNFTQFIKNFEKGKTLKKINSACKKQNKASRCTPQEAKDEILNKLFSELSLQLNLYKQGQPFKKEQSFTLDLPFYDEDQNIHIQKVVLAVFKEEQFEKVDFKEAGFMKLEVSIKSDLGK